MGFVKVVKNKAYFKRFQVKFRRRRECKTDYYARTRLILQDKNKYATPKYRLVYRRTNKDLICQVIAADFDHDRVIESAYSHELKNFGVTVGLTNYAAAYCTGLLLARRINKKFGLSYEGVTEVDGGDYKIDDEEILDSKASFRCFLDVGLQRTTTGARIFGALKGAVDGGLNVPHSSRRFPGSVKSESEKYDANPDTHRRYIFGQHVADYMRFLQEGGEDGDGNEVEADEARYAKHFAKYIAAGIDADGVEALYTKAHAAIRANPDRKERKTKDPAAYPKKRFNRIKINDAQRKNRIKQKLTAAGIPSIPKIALRVSEPKDAGNSLSVWTDVQ